LQERLLSQKHAIFRNLARSYKAHLWQDSHDIGRDSTFVVDTGNLESDTMILTLDDEGRLYEDPNFLKQYVVYWDDNDVGGRTVTAEHEAFVSAENASYLRRVRAVYVCLSLLY